MKFTNCFAVSMAATTIVSLMISSVLLTHEFALSTLLLNAGLVSAYVVPNIDPSKRAVVRRSPHFYPRRAQNADSTNAFADGSTDPIATGDDLAISAEPTATGADPIETGLPGGNSTEPSITNPSITLEPSPTGAPSDGAGGNSTTTRCHGGGGGGGGNGGHHHHGGKGKGKGKGKCKGKGKPCNGPKPTKTRQPCTGKPENPPDAGNPELPVPDPTAAPSTGVTAVPTAVPTVQPSVTSDAVIEPTADATGALPIDSSAEATGALPTGASADATGNDDDTFVPLALPANRGS